MLKTVFRTLAAAAVGAALLLSLGPVAAQGIPQPDTLVTGTVTPATAGQTVSISVNGALCTLVSPAGTTAADGTFAVVVNCTGGTATVSVNGAPTSTTFTLTPGTKTDVSVSLAPATSTPAPAATTAPSAPAPAGTPAPPRTGDSGRTTDTAPWLMIAFALVAATVVAGATVAARRRG